MKKILFTFLFAGLLIATVNAQTISTATDAATDKKVMSKAEKEAAKAKKEADLAEAFSKAGLSTGEQEKARTVLDESNEKTKPVKADASLSDDAKKEKLDAIYKERNDQLKAVMGDAKYKLFKATQKAQKEAAGPAGQ